MNTNETTASTEPTSDDPNVIRSLDDKIDNTLRALVGMGRMWASHGLRLGKIGLTTGARTLEVTANTLETLAKSFDDAAEPSTESNASS